MSHECEIFEIENRFGSSLIKSSQGILIRDFSQSLANNDSLIAKDDGVPIDQLNISELIDITSRIVCSGTYSYRIKTIEGEMTHVALSKETNESISDLDLKETDFFAQKP